MPVQAIPMALVASLYPLGLAMVLLLAAAARPRAKAVAFLVGAAACTLAIGFAVVFVLHGSGLGQRGQQQPRYGLKLALGIVLLAAAVVVARWRRKPGPHREPSRWTTRAKEGGLIAVFLAGIVLYLPSPAYLSALEQVGSSKLGTAALIGWVALVAALVLITILVPVLLFLLAPGWTIPRLRAVDSWLARHARTLLIAVLAVLGAWEAVDGLVGLLTLTPRARPVPVHPGTG